MRILLENWLALQRNNLVVIYVFLWKKGISLLQFHVSRYIKDANVVSDLLVLIEYCFNYRFFNEIWICLFFSWLNLLLIHLHYSNAFGFYILVNLNTIIASIFLIKHLMLDFLKEWPLSCLSKIFAWKRECW